MKKVFSNNELQNLISGTRQIAKSELIQTISNYLRKSKTTGTDSKENEFIKEQEAKAILKFADSNNLFYTDVDITRFIAEGAEQKVYLANDNIHVIKLNDAIFYLSWQDYFNSLLLHNYFFPTTAYELIGFTIENEIYTRQ